MRLVLTDADGRLLFCGQTLPGSIHNHLIQLRQAGLAERPARTRPSPCSPTPALRASAP
jgi:hypothetical protein